MKLTKIIYYLILLISSKIKCEIWPIVITPKQLELNGNQNIVIISDKSQSINVSLNDYKTQHLLYTKKFDVIKDEPLRVALQLTNISSSSLSKVIISVISDSKQKSESLIKLIPKSGYGFVQTDKPIYTPKENVLIRMLRLDDRLRPLTETVKLRIKNSQKIILEETTLRASAPNYFIDHKFEFPPAPKLGLWFAELWYGTNLSSNSSVSFEVKEYVLPTFDIRIKSPKFILESTPNISGSVQVDYVYGKPVNGSVVFRFGTKPPNGGGVEYFGSTSIKQLVNGSAKYFIDGNQFRQLPFIRFPSVNGFRFVVEVSAHETATGKKDKAVDDTGLFVDTPYVISYKNTFSDFKPNVETYITAQVFNVLGDIVPDLPLKISLRDRDGQVIRHNTYPNMSSMQLQTDHLGQISFPVTLEESVKQLHVLIKTDDRNIDKKEQAEAEHLLMADESKVGFIYISSKSKYSTTLSVGDTYSSKIVTRGAVLSDQIYLIVLNRGQIIYSEKIFSDKGIQLEITREMTPNIRLFVLSIARNEELVSDSIKIDVNQHNCGFGMSVENNANQILPGKTLNLLLNGSKGDSVALLGVDEAVYILRNEDRLTKSKFMKELSKSDLGCGPGMGSDFTLVSNNAGLRVITGESKATDDNHENSCLRRSPVKRVKRDLKNIVNIYSGFLRKCCILGALPSNIRRSCDDKSNILKSYMPNHQQCHSAFLQCCKAYSEPKKQFVSTHPNKNSNIDRTRIGLGTEVYVHIADEQNLEDRAFIRKDFRESWLFDVVILNQSSDVYPVTLPHSITTWSLIGMAISPAKPFCIMSAPLRLRTFQDIFIQISLPYSVVQNEQMEMIVTLFNYGTTNLPVLVYTYGVEHICSEAESVGEKAKKSIVVKQNSFETVLYPMVPLKTGNFDIKVVALWSGGGDIVVKQLNVVPPGIVVEEDLTFQLDPKNRQRRSKRSIKTTKIEDEIISENSLQKTLVNVEPDSTRNIVPGTRECIIAGIGDEYGATSYTTLKDIDQLIRQPKGCGEQTMLYMAPTLYTLKYLQSIERLNGDLKYRGLKYIRDGYKRELSFRKDNGSFSAFPTRPSSIWLTAFVMKVLCQASPYIKDDKFDPNVIESGLNWLMDEQKRDGSWTEIHAVVHESSLGGVKGTVPLTAYVLIAFHECKKVLNEEIKDNRQLENSLNKSIIKSETYLKLNQNEIIKQKNTYGMALVAYSLTFSNPQNGLKLIDALHSTANIDNNRNYKHWRHEYSVEATAYALMAMLNSGNKNSLDGLSISNWLNSVRKYSGSFDSTQDTIVALEALSKYIERQRTPTNRISLLCNITSHDTLPTVSRFKRELAFTPENARILQTFKLESDSSKLKFTTTGEGMGHMLVKLKYNVFEPPDVLCRFDLNIEVNEWKAPAESRDTNEPEIDDSFFNEFNSDLIQTLDLKHNPHNRQKRSFWENYKFPNPFRRKPNRPSTESLVSVSDSNEKNDALPQQDRAALITHINDEFVFKKNNLSRNSIGGKEGKSKLVLLLETCVRHIPRYYTDMSLIEVGILSGYKPNKDDLEEIIKMEESLVSKYEISERNVVFYFEKVPFGKPYCIQFRTIQEHSVGNTQAAMVKVYDYYHKDHTCSQLYSPSRSSEYIPTKCESQVCECAKRENCPTAKSLIEIGNIYEKRIVRARELFENLICLSKYNNVFTGTFVAQNTTTNSFKFLELKLNFIFKGNLEKNDKFVLSLNPECGDNSATKEGREVIIFGQFNEKVGHLDSSAIVYDITNDFRTDEIRNSILTLINTLEVKVRRQVWRCAAQ